MDKALLCPLCKKQSFIKKDVFLTHVQTCNNAPSEEKSECEDTDTEETEIEIEATSLSQLFDFIIRLILLSIS